HNNYTYPDCFDCANPANVTSYNRPNYSDYSDPSYQPISHADSRNPRCHSNRWFSPHSNLA
ncbi:MAG: hypothetical protein KIH69_015890, partial [Anaerolineae bacterium]|nr:hypothetical protein [Anaerolineae bacterium]